MRETARMPSVLAIVSKAVFGSDEPEALARVDALQAAADKTNGLWNV
jgi:hypothetical protein